MAWIALALAAWALAPAPALGVSTTTVQRTITDRDNDNLLDETPGEDYTLEPSGQTVTAFRRPNTASILNFLQLSDFQTVDEESPGRVPFLDTTQRAPGLNPFNAAYRPQEATSAQIVEAMVRQARNTTSPVTGERLQLTMVTGDNADSEQYNETRWFIDILDGRHRVDPNSGVPVPGCEATPGTPYDGPKGGGKLGYYNPDGSDDGDGYSPSRAKNLADVGRDVTVRDFPGLLDAAQSPFESVGLDMPWYSAFGNHDALVQGNDPDAYEPPGETPNPVLQAFVTGCANPFSLPPPADPVAAFTQFFSDPQGYVDATHQAAIVPPDQRRCYLAKDSAPGGSVPPPCQTGGWIEQHFITTGEPVGHGFAPTVAADCVNVPAEAMAACQNALTPDERAAGYGRPPQAVANHDGYYSFSPRPGVRFVVLDTITDECVPTPFCSDGSIDDAQYRWLDDQLNRAAQMGQYVIGFSHQTLRTIRLPSSDPTEQPIHFGERFDPRTGDPVQPAAVDTLEDLYCRHPNVIAHVDGHEHVNAVIHHSCREQDSSLGPGDFWEVTSASHIDWPQQSRMLELFHDDDGSMSLALTMIDHGGPANPGAPKPGEPVSGNAGESVLRMASIGRELSYNDYQAGPKSGNGDARGSRTDRNVIIRLGKPFPCGSPCGTPAS